MDGLTADGLPETQAARADWKRSRDESRDRDGGGLWGTDLGGEREGERAAWLFRAIEVEIIPRLMLAHQEAVREPVRPLVGPVSKIGPAEVAEFTGVVLTDQTAESVAYVDELLSRGIGMEAVHLELLAPVGRRLGTLWEEDLIDFTEVTVGLWRLQQVLREFSSTFRGAGVQQSNGRRALFGAVPGEQHTLGLLMVAEFFRTAGWHVWDEPASSIDALEKIVAAEWFDIAGLSAGCDARVDVLSSAILAIRRASSNRSISVIVGGPLFIRYPELAQSVGADAMAPDAKRAVVQAEQLVARQGSQS
jgi:methanogenic corrinoid protein MtbC1